MYRRCFVILLAAVLALGLAGCGKDKRVKNPIADIGSKQPDKVLFDRSMEALKQRQYDVARMTLQTLISTYPDSEFVARAKLAIADSWYLEGTGAALGQAENEYKDFITFFPDMAEAAEAQMKVADIHYKQMEKPDRDFTHAKRAEYEYRQMILQYPDSKLVPEAKRKLLEVQEVLAEREFRIGRFYYLRESWAAAVARLRSLVDTYPLYSGASDALMMLGNIYEREIEFVRASRYNESAKGKLIREFTDEAAAAYSRVITRYPATPSVEEAKKRLAALQRPVPTPTPEAIAQNKTEEQSRGESGMFRRFKLNLRKGPDMAEAVKVGEPTLVDPQQTSAVQVVKRTQEQTAEALGASRQSLSVETVKGGAPGPNQPVPRSDEASTPAPPDQVNEVASGNGDSNAQAEDSTAQDPKQTSSSKKKKKKGLGKLNPF